MYFFSAVIYAVAQQPPYDDLGMLDVSILDI
jgi:hypothetical protein